MIDIKELRVGAHIKLGDKMRCVSNIDLRNGRIGISGNTVCSDGVQYVIGYELAYIAPIPITAELLQEIGFERLAQLGSMSAWARDDIYISIVGERVAARIVNDKIDLSIPSICYLHELEAFVYLTTKQELIKEDWL